MNGVESTKKKKQLKKNPTLIAKKGSLNELFLLNVRFFIFVSFCFNNKYYYPLNVTLQILEKYLQKFGP